MSNNYSVKLGTCDKITAIKIYREITGVGLSEAKDVIDKTPGIIFKNLSLSEANEIVRKFQQKGCLAEVVEESEQPGFQNISGNESYFSGQSNSRRTESTQNGPDISILSGKELLDALKKAKESILTAEKLQGQMESVDVAIDELKKKCKAIETKSGVITYLGTFIFSFIGISMFQFIGLVIGLIGGWFVSGIIDSLVNGDKNKEKAKNYYEQNYPPLERKRNELKDTARRFFNSQDFAEAREVIPNDYFDSVSAEYLVKVVENKRANSISECINLYEEYLHRSRMEEMQRQQVALAEESVKAQKEIAKAAKEQAESARKIARNTRATTRAVKLNTFVNLMKK